MAGATSTTGGGKVDATMGNLNVSGLPLLNEDIDVIVHVSYMLHAKSFLSSTSFQRTPRDMHGFESKHHKYLSASRPLTLVVVMIVLLAFVVPDSSWVAKRDYKQFVKYDICRMKPDLFLTPFGFCKCSAACPFALPAAQTKFWLQETGP